MSAAPPNLAAFDVCGTPALERVLRLLYARGYRRTDGRPAAPGEYSYDHGDAAPGWADWMYEVEVALLPGETLRELLAAVERP